MSLVVPSWSLMLCDFDAGAVGDLIQFFPRPSYPLPTSGCLLVHPNFAVHCWVHFSTARGYLEMGRDMEKNLWSGHELVCGQAQILISCLVLSSPMAASFISQVVVWFKIYQNIFASSVKLNSWKSRPGL